MPISSLEAWNGTSDGEARGKSGGEPRFRKDGIVKSVIVMHISKPSRSTVHNPLSVGESSDPASDQIGHARKLSESMSIGNCTSRN